MRAQLSGNAPEKQNSQWLNTASTAITALIAIPALILSLITYYDQKFDSEESDRKEASRVVWYWETANDPDRPLQYLVVENRSLRPVYEAFINIEDDSGKNRQVFYIDGTVAPCTRTTYTLGRHSKEVLDDLYAEMFFRDTLGTIWRTSYSGRLKKLSADVVTMSADLDVIEKWGLFPKYEDLGACS